MAVIGGLWRIEGAWLGAFAFIVIENYVRDFQVPGLSFGGTLFGGSFNTIIGILFLLVVCVSPGGLMGIWDRVLAAPGRARRATRRVPAAPAEQCPRPPPRPHRLESRTPTCPESARPVRRIGGSSHVETQLALEDARAAGRGRSRPLGPGVVLVREQ